MPKRSRQQVDFTVDAIEDPEAVRNREGQVATEALSLNYESKEDYFGNQGCVQANLLTDCSCTYSEDGRVSDKTSLANPENANVLLGVKGY